MAECLFVQKTVVIYTSGCWNRCMHIYVLMIYIYIWVSCVIGKTVAYACLMYKSSE